MGSTDLLNMLLLVINPLLITVSNTLRLLCLASRRMAHETESDILIVLWHAMHSCHISVQSFSCHIRQRCIDFIVHFYNLLSLRS
jgi:hypothetical protein